MFGIVWKSFAVVILFVRLSLVFAIGNILVRLSCARSILVKAMHKIASVPLQEELFWDSLFSWAMIKSLWNLGVLDIRKTALRGKPTPNPLLVDSNTGNEIKLLKTLSPRKLQVLAFGSYSCPVFRMKLDQLKSIAEESHNLADFFVIYIDEAHPADGWVFKDDIAISKHRTIDDRLKAARKLSFGTETASPIRLFADSMKNEASRMYGVNSIRLYVVQDETVVYEGGVGPTYYSLEEVKQVIRDTSITLV